MPESLRAPKYRRHKATGLAVVVLDGRSIYLGKHGSAASKGEYRRITSEWLASGGTTPPADHDRTIVELLAHYLPYAGKHYRHADGSPTGEIAEMKYSMGPLRDVYGHTPVK